MRIATLCGAGMVLATIGCASTPAGGTLGEGTVAAPKITSADTTRPPRFAWIELTEPAYAALLLVAPGHSATLLYPRDSSVDNHLSAGTHQLTFEVPRLLAQSDSERVRQLRQRLDSVSRGTARGSGNVRGGSGNIGAISATTPTYLLLITSPQPLVYRRILEKTAGVSIPTIEMEALNAVGKAVRSTIQTEPRDWAGAYTRVVVRRP